MLYIILFICGLCLCFFLCLHLKFGEKSILRYVLEANNLFCIQYLIFSSVFLYTETFSVLKPLAVLLLLDAAAAFLLIVRRHRGSRLKEIRRTEKRENVLLGVLVFLCLPFLYLTSEDIGAVSDQGAYFLHTVVLMEGKTGEIHRLPEMNQISETVDEGLRELQDQLIAYYHEDGEDYYYIHGLNTWCCFTALFGKMLGIWNCMKGVNYLFVLVILNVFYVCEKIALHKDNVYLVTGIFALSPVVLYIGKAGLTEILMLYLFAAGLHYLLGNKRAFCLLAGICVGLTGFAHISIYVYMPAITAGAMLASTKKKWKNLAFFNIVQLFLFACSQWYAAGISPIYTKRQYFRFTLNGKLNHQTVFIIVDALIVVLAAIQLGVFLNKIKLFTRLRKLLCGHFHIFFILGLVLIVGAAAYYTYFLCFTDKFAIPEGYDAGTWNLRSRYVGAGLIAASHLNLVNMARGTGILGLLAFLLIPFGKKPLRDLSKAFYLLELYALIVFTVLQMDTPSNYYSSRYFVPFAVPLVTVALVSSVDKKSVLLCILTGALLFNRRYWFAFLQGAPQMGQYELLQDTMKVIPEGAVVLCGAESDFLNTRLTGNLRLLNQNEVYNLKNYEEVDTYYPDKEKYILSAQELDTGAGPLLSGVYLSQYSFGNGPNGTYDTIVGTYTIPIYIYKAAGQ